MSKHYDLVIVGAGPAGLAAAIQIKTQKPDIDVCVIDKALDLGNHNLSGAVLEPQPFHQLLDAAVPDWQQSDQAKDVLARKVVKDNIMFFVERLLFFRETCLFTEILALLIVFIHFITPRIHVSELPFRQSVLPSPSSSR